MTRLLRPVSFLLAAAMWGPACLELSPPPPVPEAPVVDPCAGLTPLTLAASPSQVRVSGVALLAPGGGSGHYRLRLEPGGSSGQVSGERFVAGPTPGTDTVVVEDARCPGDARAQVTVVAAFDVAPARAVVRPGASFQVQARGVLGTADFTLVGSEAGSTVTATGLYTAGTGQGVDLVRVRDGRTGDEALLRYEVRAGAKLVGDPALLALPAGSSVPLAVRDGSDSVQWAKVSGPGAVQGGRFLAQAGERGEAVLEATDAFTGDTARVRVRVLEELTRPVQAHGRLSDTASIVTADFDGDGVPDVAVGRRESDLTRPLGGAVFVFKGSALGLPTQPGNTLSGESDTAQFGDVLAAGDLDGDGRAELAVSSPGADFTVGDSGAVYLYRFEGGGPVPMRAPLVGLGRGSFGAGLAIADADGDGDMDLLVGSPTGDLAPTRELSRRGVVDVFLLTPGQPVPELPSVRLGGSDLGRTGAVEARSSTEFGRALVAADLNGDGRTDIAALSRVTRWLPDGTSGGFMQAVAVHLARESGARFRATPDVYVLPDDAADTNEGTWRLGAIPGEGSRPPLLVVSADRADSPDLRTSGGVQSGTDAGGVYLFDVSAQKPTGEPLATPPKLEREQAFARLYGDVRYGVAGRSWAVVDVDGTAGPELVLGAPYVYSPAPGTTGPSLRLNGKLLVFPLATLAPGSVLNSPQESLSGGSPVDVLGAGLAAWNLGTRPGLVAFAGRASTDQGAFTGRVDALLKSGATLAEWERTSASVPARAAAERFGEAVLLGRGPSGKLLTVVGSPGWSGPGASEDGNDMGAGRAYVHDALAGGAPAHVEEGRNSPLWRGRNVGADVAFTDFNGDGRQDLVVGAPSFTVPGTGSRATEVTPVYAQERTGCLTTSSNITLGGALVSLGQTDGTFQPAYRLWGPPTLAGCTPESDSRCQRRGQGRGVVGGFDLNGDGLQDIGVLRNNGFELFLGRAPDDSSLEKLTMGCDPVFSSDSFSPRQTSAPVALGDLDQDGCDEVAFRYSDRSLSGVVVLFGHDAGGARCSGRSQPAWVRLAADSEVGMSYWGLGVAMQRVGRFLGDARNLLAISASSVPYEGVTQPVVLLFDTSLLAARRPASGEALVAATELGLAPVMLVPRTRAVNFGQSLAGGADVTGDGVPDLVVGATGASVASDAGGAVFVYAGGPAAQGALTPWVTVVGDVAERASFGQALSLAPGVTGSHPPMLLIGAPTSYRTGTQNGTAFTLPLGP